MSADSRSRLSGRLLVAGDWVTGQGAPVRSLEAETGTPLEPAYFAASDTQLAAACSAAAACFDEYRRLNPRRRARFLDAIAHQIEDLGEALIIRAMCETGLPRTRLESETSRTCNQLRLFGSALKDGKAIRARHDPALPDRQPAPRPDLRLDYVPLGPVVVFGASNFPLAFSVAGGDTASALAAGCPVIVKAHPAHLGTSELVGKAVSRAIKDCGMPSGVFSLLVGADFAFGTALVTDPHVRAVGFTGSRSGGLAICAAAARRAVPIPVYAEMSSINPVILLPDALATRAPAIAEGLADSLNLGAGQFCTNPGLVLFVDGPEAQRFTELLVDAVRVLPSQIMLTPEIARRYNAAVKDRQLEARLLARGKDARSLVAARAALFEVDAATFERTGGLQEEIFGPTSLIVRCSETAQIRDVLEGLEGQLTISIHADVRDEQIACGLMAILERKAGRVLFNGFGTGVEVAPAMVHGGPFPATSDGRSTSVGTLAMDRFLRPVCYQDVPGFIPFLTSK